MVQQFKIPVSRENSFDKQIVEAMLHCKSIVEWKPSLEASEEIKNIWKIINC
jgi:MinD superfamily P-loop ATPase